MKTLINYNSIDAFSGVGPVPFVALQDSAIRLHDRWAIGTQITLAGIVTGDCALDFSQLINNQKRLVNNFSQDFKPLTISENGQTIFSAPYCTIDSINFNQSKYVRTVPYEITINCFPQDLFSGAYGVIEPENNISYQEEEGGIINVSRVISAKGFNTNSQNGTNNAWDNARIWVQSRTGWNPNYFGNCLPHFIQYKTGIIPCLKQQAERNNRFEGTYSIEEQYSFNSKATSPVILKYSTDVSYDTAKGIYESTIQGDFEYCPTENITGLRQAYKQLDLYSIANYELKKNFPLSPNLNPEFLSDEVEEIQSLKKLSFSRSFDTDPRSPVQFDYEMNVDFDVISDVHTISLNGSIRSRNSQKIRWDRVLQYYQSLDLFGIVNTFYIQMGYPFELVPYPISYSVTENEVAGEINIQVSYDNRNYPYYDFDDFEHTVEIAPSINQYIPVPVICGNYTLINLNALKRARISVNGSAFSLDNSDKTPQLRNIFAAILSQYIESPSTNRVIKEDNVTSQREAQGKSYGITVSETYTGPEFKFE